MCTDAGMGACVAAPATRRRNSCRVPEVLLHSAGAASRGAALLVGCILPVCALLAPCAPGASPPSVLTGLRGRDTGNPTILHLRVGALPDELRRRGRRGSAVRDAVRDPDGPKSTARHEQSWIAREARFESCDPFGVSDIVLRACIPPAMDQREQGSARDAEHGRELACGDAGEV